MLKTKKKKKKKENTIKHTTRLTGYPRTITRTKGGPMDTERFSCNSADDVQHGRRN